MTKEEILNYVMNTPENTNRMVLNDMLDKLVNSNESNSDYFDVLFTLTGGGVTCDQTFEEAAAAISAGKSLRAKLISDNWPTDGAISDLSASVYFVEGNVYSMQFATNPNVNVDSIEQIGIEWLNSGTLEWREVDYTGSEPEPEPEPDPSIIN